MVKLNYTNRKIDGVKLGAVVARDLRKRATTFAKKSDAHRDSAANELDLNLAGRNLTDDGLRELAPGLEDALQAYIGDNPCTKLEELNLAGNALTTRSLALLARAIPMAKYDLKELDLSNNKIQVKTKEEAQEWELFLDSFSGCRDFRRLDLTGNDLSGPLALEILTRVYSKHAPVDPTDLEGQRLAADAAKHLNGEMDGATLGMEDLTVSNYTWGPPHDSPQTPMEFSMSTGTILKRRCGLRSVPYIVLSNTTLGDSGALWLSYVLPIHYFPQHLMTPLKPGPVAIQLDEYRHKHHCWGLVYVPNEKLSSAGEQLLSQAEAVRQELLGINEDPMASSVGSIVHVHAMQGTTRRRNSSGAASRRLSTLSVEGVKPLTAIHEAHTNGTEIDRLRTKLQRTTVEEFGAMSVQLWACALKMLVSGRAILLAQVDNFPKKHTFASKLIATASAEQKPIFTITDITNEPVPPTVVDYTALSHANGAASRLSWIKPTTNGKKTLLQTVLDADCSTYRDNSLLGTLTMPLWQRILALAAEADGVLTEEQQNNVLLYAQDRYTLQKELGMLGKPDSAQIWMVLDSMNCLAYEIRT